MSLVARSTVTPSVGETSLDDGTLHWIWNVATEGISGMPECAADIVSVAGSKLAEQADQTGQ